MVKIKVYILALLISIAATAQDKANYRKLKAIALWPDKPIKQTLITDKLSGIKNPFILAYLPEKNIANGTSLLICPSGGYSHLAWTKNVERLAPLFTSKGIAVIGLAYRTIGNRIRIPDHPLKDLNQAIKLIKKNADKWLLDKEKIVGLGFSAGANLLLEHACRVEGEKIKYLNMLCLWPRIHKAKDYKLKKKGLDVIMFSSKEDRAAPTAFSVDIAKSLNQSSSEAKLITFPKGNHLAFDFEENGPKLDWTKDFLKWLKDKKLLKE